MRTLANSEIECVVQAVEATASKAARGMRVIDYVGGHSKAVIIRRTAAQKVVSADHCCHSPRLNEGLAS
jgi:hypothetical protein